MNTSDDRSCPALATLTVSLPVAFDRWSAAELEAATPALIALDRAGRIVAVSARAARWMGVLAWQVRGRELLAELRWALGDVAAQRVAEILRGGPPSASTRAAGRRGAPVDLELVRGRDRLYLTLAVPGG